eukprot:TRINITY_DN58115_c0_g1_i1.p1 TRINITY_DN58115_c0_g1~~TRINITY_DN58115_c0_g1_i1.p1  ORF type:complete len:122 (+),score=22.98 TRINITY_DN58115_c0_g1_i1:55-420(+)
MGAQCCQEERLDDRSQVADLGLDKQLNEHQPALPPDAGDLLRRLEGKWLRQEDNMSLGRISKQQMTWEPIYRHKPTGLREDASRPNVLWMTMGKTDYSGIVSFGSVVTIEWEDGEVWEKCA